MAEGNKLSILDVSNPAQPIVRARLPLPVPIRSLQVIGNLAYIMSEVGLYIVDVSDVVHPVLQSSFVVPSIKGMQVTGSLAYVMSEVSLYIVDVSDAAHLVLQSSFAVSSARYWQVIGNFAYILKQELGSGEAAKLFIVDVSNPQEPIIYGDYQGTLARVTAMSITSNFVYLANNGLRDSMPTYEMEIIDISNARQPVLRNILNVGAIVDYFKVLNGVGYAIVRTKSSHNLPFFAIFDITDPDQLKLIYQRYLDPKLYASVIQVVDNLVYMGYASPQFVDPSLRTVIRVEIVDISDRTNPILLSSYNGLKRGVPSQILVADERAYVPYTVHGGSSLIEMIDVHDVANPTLAGKYFAPGAVHDIAVVDDAVYIGTEDGLHIVDLITPTLPVLRGSYEITGVHDVDVVNDLAYISTAENGMQILDVSNPVTPIRLWPTATSSVMMNDRATVVHGVASQCGHPDALRVLDNWAYIGSYCAFALFLVDVSNPLSPTQQGIFGNVVGGVTAIDVLGSYAYLIEEEWSGARLGAVQIVDISNPDQPILRSTYHTHGTASDIQVMGHFAYIPYDGLYILDVGDPTNPTLQSFYRTIYPARHVAVAGNFVYVSTDEGLLEVIDVFDPTSPVRKGVIFRPGAIQDVQIINDLVYLAGNGGVEILRIHPERFPAPVYLPFIQK